MPRDERYTQRWEEIEQQFPGSSAAFDRDLGDAWLAGRDGPRFDIYGPVLHVFVGESVEMDHHGPWASAFFDADQEKWIVKADHRRPFVTRWTLAWRDHETRGSIALARESRYLVGRTPDVAIQTTDPLVTKHHARFEWRDDAWTVRDLGSANGTFCNGKRIDRATPLRPGDQIQCGDVVITVYGA